MLEAPGRPPLQDNEQSVRTHIMKISFLYD